MCGIVGAFGPSARELADHMPAALDSIAHRGPDASGHYLDSTGHCLLGHRRLSIVDLSTGANQPMLRPQAAFVFNGEIYNHMALRQTTLSAQVFETHSDTETLLQLINTQGLGALHQAQGMFAGAYYDETTQQLLLFRDPLGIKPLYWAQLPDSTVVFASEVKALLTLTPALKRTVDTETLGMYLQYENYAQGDSLFHGIQLMPLGGCLTLQLNADGQVTMVKSSISLAQAYTQKLPIGHDLLGYVHHALKRAVQSHLMSDVDLGVYLSGGIDSSLVATFATQDTQNLVGFTGYFKADGDYYDERPIAQAVADQLGMMLHAVEIGPQNLIDNFDAVMMALDEPRMGMGTFSQYMVAQEAAKHRKVILAGHGGDELFGGYPLFKAFWLLESGFSLQSLLCLTSLKPKEWPWVIDQWMEVLRSGQIRFAPKLFGQLPQPLAQVLQSNPFMAGKTQNPLAQLHQYYQSVYLPGLLVAEDKISMAHSLETRVPFWSQPLITDLARIPIEQKIQGGQLKGLLREVAKSLLPEEVLKAPKRGFPTPLRLWFRTSLMDFIQHRLVETSSRLHHLVPAHEIAALILAHQRQPLPFALDERRAHRIWMLLCLESWLRQFDVAFPAEVMAT